MVTMAPPFPTNQQAEFTSLSIFENAEIKCHTHSCLISGIVDIIALAKNDLVLFIEPAYFVQTANSNAVNQSGLTGLLEDSGLSLDGSGETVMFVDTGIDINHPDLEIELQPFLNLGWTAILQMHIAVMERTLG